MDDARLRELFKDMPMSDDFAVLLDLKKSTIISGKIARDEIEKLVFLTQYLRRLRMETESQQEIIWSRFCALYLPATVDRFLEPPPAPNNARPAEVQELKLNNAYFEMLVAIQHTPYFAKYFRSSKPIAAGGKRLAQAIAERLVELGPTWDKHMLDPPSNRPDDYYSSVTASAVQLLSTLLTTFIKEQDQSVVVSPETKSRLMPLLRKWIRRYPRDFLGEVCMRTWMTLDGKSDFTKELQSVRRTFKNWSVCGLPFCDVEKDLKACGNCQTVRYCTPEHQRAHWKYKLDVPHKQICQKTVY